MHFVYGSPFFSLDQSNRQQFTSLDKSIKTEYLVVGAGVSGALVAYQLSKAGAEVTLVDKASIAMGSTSITTALLQYELDRSAQLLHSTGYPMKKIEAAYKLGKHALKWLDNWIQTNGNECDYETRRTTYYTTKQQEVNIVKDEYAFRQSIGFPVTLTEGDGTFSEVVKAAITDENGGAELNPYLFTHHLIRQAITHGCQVYENTPIIELLEADEASVAKSTYGNTITAKKVIITTGYDINQFLKRHLTERHITFNIVTEPLKNDALRNQICLLRDTSNPYYYLRTTRDNRVIVGGADIPLPVNGTIDESTAFQQYKILQSYFRELFPNEKRVKIANAYCGVFASTIDDLGFIGEDPINEGVSYCLGYGANGILFALLGGIYLTQKYQGELDEVGKQIEMLFTLRRS